MALPLAEWQERSLCKTAIRNGYAEASWWDSDAGYEKHVKAESLCMDCPVAQACLADAWERKAESVARMRPDGVYGGLIWTRANRPEKIDDYHCVPRKCARPECDEVFTPRARQGNGKQRYHDAECRRLADLAAERERTNARRAQRREARAAKLAGAPA